METLYETLKVHPEATQEDIKQSYRAMSKEHHPDKAGDKNEFARLSRAYMVLSDTQKRKRYDETGLEDDTHHTNNLASGLIQRLFNGLLKKHGPEKILTVNIIKDIKACLDQLNNEAKAEKSKLLSSRKKLEKVLHRIIHKSKNNVLSSIIQNEIEENKHQFTNFSQSIETASKAKEMIREYKFKFDKAPEGRLVTRVVSMGGFGAYTSTGS